MELCESSPLLLKEKGPGDEVHWIERSEVGSQKMEDGGWNL
jgi:hypothetical protein